MENQKQSDNQELAELKSKLVKYESMDKYQNDEIDLREFFHIIWLGKWKMLVITAFFAAASVFYALSLPDIYKSEALLAPNADESSKSGLSSLAGQFGGLASLAGMDLGSSGGPDKVSLALEVLQSRQFIYKFVADNNLKELLLAVKDWDRASNKFVYNLDIYNPETKEWVGDKSSINKTKEPTLFRTYEYFLNHTLEVTQDISTGLVTLSINHYSPYLAKELVDNLIVAINLTIKQQDLSEATKSIQYLTNELLNTNVSGMQTMFYQLIEQQQQTLMLTKVRADYVLKIIDPAIVVESKYKPKRALICILGTLIGGVFAVLFVLVRYFSRNI
jgi:uncharacterized protein involved in exopolysaccharide biosynthesis